MCVSTRFEVVLFFVHFFLVNGTFHSLTVFFQAMYLPWVLVAFRMIIGQGYVVLRNALDLD